MRGMPTLGKVCGNDLEDGVIWRKYCDSKEAVGGHNLSHALLYIYVLYMYVMMMAQQMGQEYNK